LPGNDDIRDTWSPYGTGDLLERAAIIGWKGDFRRDAQVEAAFDLISSAAARALGIGDYGITVGARPICSRSARAASPRPSPLIRSGSSSFFDGNVVARDGSFLPAPVPIARLVAASEGERQQGSRDTGAL